VENGYRNSLHSIQRNECKERNGTYTTHATHRRIYPLCWPLRRLRQLRMLRFFLAPTAFIAFITHLLGHFPCTACASCVKKYARALRALRWMETPLLTEKRRSSSHAAKACFDKTETSKNRIRRKSHGILC